MNSDLSKRWFTPKEDLLYVPPSLGAEERFIVPTDDGGFILGGDMGDSFLRFIYLVKVDHEGIKEWDKTYIDFPLTEMLGLVAVDDGYVLAAYSGTLSNFWLVKLNEQGILLSTEEIESFTQDRYFDIHPNPAHQTVNIQFREAFSGNMIIYNMAGQRMFQADLDHEMSFYLSIQDFPVGIYIVKVFEAKTGRVQSDKFVKY